MNKWCVWMAAVIVGSAVTVSGSAGAAEMNGMYDFSKVEMMQYNGTELVPLRKVAESLGYRVQWNEQDRSVLLMKGSTETDSGMTENKGMMGGITDNAMKMNEMKEKMTPPESDKTTMGKEGMVPAVSDKEGMEMPANEMAGITIKIGSNTIMVNGGEKKVMNPAVILMDMTYVGKDLVDTYLIAGSKMK